MIRQAKYPLVIIHIADDLLVHVNYAEDRSGHYLPRRGRRSPRGLCRTSSGRIGDLVDNVVVHVDYVEHYQVMIDLHIKSMNWYALISSKDCFYLSLGISAQSFL